MRPIPDSVSMRARLGLLLLLVLLAAAGVAMTLRWSFFSQAEHPTLRLSERVLPPLTDRLVVLLVDSVPFDMAFTQKKLPYIASQASRGTHGIARSEEPTMTGQMVYTIATGMRPFLYGVVRNWRQNRFPHETALDALGAAGLRLEIFGDAPWIEMFGDRFDHHVTFPEDGRQPDGRPYEWMHAVNDIDLRILPHLDRSLADPKFDVLLWHIHGTDLVMHKYLRDSRPTAEKLVWADLLVEGVVRQLDDGRTTFLILSDHGCARNGRHGYGDPEARPTFYLLFGPKITRGLRLDLRQIDFAPTLAALFGRSPSAASAGRPAVEALEISLPLRARVLVDAARNRARYLAAREQRQAVGARPDVDPLREAEAALGAGEHLRAAAAASRFLRQAYRVDLDSRRERRWGPPIALALGLLALLAVLAILSFGPLLSSVAERRRPGVAPAALTAALGLAMLWGLGLVVARWNGRFFNDHLDLFSPLAKVSFWGAFVAVLGGLALVLWRPLRRAYGAHPGLWTFAACLGLAVLPGYFQGIYALVFALALLGIALVTRGDPTPRAWLGLLLSAAVLVFFLLWEWDWEPHCFHLREHFRQELGAAAAGLGFLLATLAVLTPWAGGTQARAWPRALVAPLVLCSVVIARHLLVPLEPRDLFPTVGDQLLAGTTLRGAFTALGALAWWTLHRAGWLRGPEGSALGALATLALWGSAFEAAAFGLLVVAFAPFSRLRWLDRPGLGGAAFAAALLITARIVLLQVHEFHLHFTALHDLFGFAPDTDEALTSVAWPLGLRYALPALVLVALLWGRLSPRTRLAALGVVLVFTGARVIHLVLITRLTIDQLYANWRGLGELILTGLVAVTLALAVTAWEVGAWATRARSPESPGPEAPQDAAVRAEGE